jgi:phenylacetate-coenzyme A ligase PaaK-like adenylate-forming protein
MLERADIAKLFDEALASFIAKPPADPREHSVHVTSGTTGKEPIVMPYDHEKQLRAFPTWYWGSERVLICYGPRVLRTTNTIFVTRDPALATRVLTLDGDDVLSPALTSLLDDFAPERIIGSTSFVLRAGECMGLETAARVRSVKCVGESMTKAHEAAFKQRFPNARVSTGYFSMELGGMSKETCGYLPANQYHPRDDMRFEIMEPDADGVGDIVVSAETYGLAIERYMLGDVGRITNTACACGETVRIEILGRKGLDYIKIAGSILRRDEFDRVAALFPQVIDDYRIEASSLSEGVVRGKIRMQAVSKHGIPTEALQRETMERFSRAVYLTPSETLADLVARGAFEPLEIEWISEPFPATNKIIKLREI